MVDLICKLQDRQVAWSAKVALTMPSMWPCGCAQFPTQKSEKRSWITRDCPHQNLAATKIVEEPGQEPWAKSEETIVEIQWPQATVTITSSKKKAKKEATQETTSKKPPNQQRTWWLEINTSTGWYRIETSLATMFLWTDVIGNSWSGKRKLRQLKQ